MLTLEDFHQFFTQSVLSDTESREVMKAQSFVEKVCEDLVLSGDLSDNYSYAEYYKKGIEACGYDFDEERRILTVINCQYFQDDMLQTLTKNIIESKFNRLRTFFQKSIEGLYKQLEESSEAFSMAYQISQYNSKKKIDRVRLLLLTDGTTTRSLKEIQEEVFNGITYEYRIVDIEYLFKTYTSIHESGDFEVEFDLPFLDVNSKGDYYQSFLTVVPGDKLVQIYEKFGQKLFEQNVRTFLQFRGNTNKGLKNTIETKPEMFFAYNNGITATASSVEFGKNGNISMIKNFQIVNGGQTTSAIYAAHKISKLNVADVAVQMKLSVVKDLTKQGEFVSKVAEYANTQNKINPSDFFSNSPFHKDFKDYSKRIYASATSGAQRRTLWFYERVRGEYLNSQVYLNKRDTNKFILENPKNQLIDKTLLAKAENTWSQLPHIVSKGAQDSFRNFADRITKLLENDNLAITEGFFKEAIAKVILFKHVEKMVSDADWYDGGFRAQTVTYSLAYLSALISSSNENLNLLKIWNEQKVPNSIDQYLQIISKEVYKKITNPPAGYANVSQYCKNILCWSNVQKIDIDFPELDSTCLIDKEEIKFKNKEDKVSKKIDDGISIQMEVVTKKIEYWKKLHNYFLSNMKNNRVSDLELDIVERMALGSIAYPSEKQSKILHKLMQLAKKEGFYID